MQCQGTGRVLVFGRVSYHLQQSLCICMSALVSTSRGVRHIPGLQSRTDCNAAQSRGFIVQANRGKNPNRFQPPPRRRTKSRASEPSVRCHPNESSLAYISGFWPRTDDTDDMPHTTPIVVRSAEAKPLKLPIGVEITAHLGRGVSVVRICACADHSRVACTRLLQLLPQAALSR